MPDGLAALEGLRAPGTANVHQVGIVVADLDAAVAEHSRLRGCTPDDWRIAEFGPASVDRLEPTEYTARLAFHGSGPELELIQVVDGESVYDGRRGLHHLAVVVTSLEQTVAAMERAGHATLQAGWGFAPDGRGGFAYFDTVAALGYLLEAVELP